MRDLVPGEPTGRLSDAWRLCVGTGRFDLAPRRDYQDSPARDQLLTRGEDHLVTRDGTGRGTVLAWAPVDVTGGPAVAGHTVRLRIPFEAPSVFMSRSSVSEEMGNAWAAWCEMGRPRSPHPRGLDILREAAEPVRRHRSLPAEGGSVDLDLTLDRHEVTLVELTPVADETPPWWDGRRILGWGERTG